MENQKFAKIAKILFWALMGISVGLLVWGFIAGFETKDGAMTDVLLYWAYIMLGIAIGFVICLGIYAQAITNPKGLIKLGIVAVGAVVLVGIVYLISPGNPAVGLNSPKLPTPGELKLTDTILNLAYIIGVLAILAIIAGEIVMATRKK